MSSWHNRQRRVAARKRQAIKRLYIFSDGSTLMTDDHSAVDRKVRLCHYEVSYRVVRLDGRAA